MLSEIPYLSMPTSEKAPILVFEADQIARVGIKRNSLLKQE